MRAPLSWLREYVAVETPAAEIAERLSISSCEVVGLSVVGPTDEAGNLELLQVGRVVDVSPHPSNERLNVCAIAVGESEARTIISGAPNVSRGAFVAVALPGARLPSDPSPIEPREFGGVVSEGMLLSERDLGIGENHTGIMLLEGDLIPGAPLADASSLFDQVLEVEVTGNRPDLLSMYGLAREVSMLFDAELRPLTLARKPPSERRPVDISVEDLAACPRYIGRLFDQVTIGPSPLWLRTRLHAAGVRTISNVVDVTNYVMLALGSPLHAFDINTLADRAVVVRRARAGEKIRTLDAVDRELDPRDLVIADHARPIAVAGIMGGAETEISPQTTEVLLEAANFDPVVTLESSHRLRLRTESSSRWEKGVDPAAAEVAAQLATQMLNELAHARWVGETQVQGDLPRAETIHLRTHHSDEIVGQLIPPARQREILSKLGFTVSDAWMVAVPSWRARDITREIDLIEEIARVELERIPFELPNRSIMFGRLTPEQRVIRRIQDVLVGCGLHEVYTPSLSAHDPTPNALWLANPSTPDQAVLRTTLLTGLVEAARQNSDVRNSNIELFEVARIYLPTGGALPEERYHVAGIVQGDFIEVKGIVETLLDHLHIEAPVTRAEHPLLHPGKTAGIPGGWFGEVNPQVVTGAWAAFELDVPNLVQQVPERVQFKDVISFPAISEDLAFTVDRYVPAGDLISAMHEAAGPELREAHIFDVYEGPQVGDGRKSVAVAVRYQSSERTLTDADAARLRVLIVDALGKRFEATLRS
jgi:phenylalanyl-tRNA synthetase beta chain